MNSVNIMGRITKDLELKKVGDDLSLLNFSIALEDGYGDKKKTFFFDVIAWRMKADVISQYFKKGDRILINGRLTQENWKTQDGNNRSKVVISLYDFDFVERKSESGNNASQSFSTADNANSNANNNSGVEFQDFSNDDNDDIPF